MNREYIAELLQIAERNLLDLEKAKAAGRLVVGFYCLYSPVEIALAADAVALPLCGTRNDPIASAEEILPRNLCPLIKSSFGVAATDSCPYFHLADIIVGDTTCDGKKKMFELLNNYKPTHVLQLPQTQDSPMALVQWRHELARLQSIIEEASGRRIDDERLRAAIRLMNRNRLVRKAVMDLNRMQPAPLPGSMLLELLFKLGFLTDREQGITLMEKLARTAAAGNPGERSGSGRSRILLTGVPVGLGSDKVVRLVEQCGADVVAFENCSGYKQAFVVDEEMEPMEALARQYLATPCSVMSPNAGRLTLLAQMIEDFAVDGVIDLT